MKKKQSLLPFLLFIILITGCSKTEKKIEITDETYIIMASNLSVHDILLTIKTSLDPEKSFTIPKNSTKKIYIRASAGEYVTFTVTKNACEYRILDSRGATIALHQSFPSSTGTAELDFIAFAPADQEKNFISYKTGLAKAIGENLVGRPYVLSERYFLENATKTDNSAIQAPCTYSDEYIFIPQRGQFGNFNPERMIFSTGIDKSRSSCSYGAGPIISTGSLSVIVNGTSTVSFPIWDPLAIDGSPSSMIDRQLIIDSINSSGILTLHREVNNGKKEVFVYKPK